jgi:DNA-binding PadR family transcriptional regulator
MVLKKTYLGEFELMILLAALRLEDTAYGLAIAQEIERRTGREVSRGSLYVTFDRLQSKGYVTSKLAGKSGERGGRPKRYVRVTPKGLRAVREAHSALDGLFQGLNALQDS